MDKKRFLFALGFAVLAAVLAYVIYRVFFAAAPPPAPVIIPGGAPSGAGSALPSSGTGAQTPPSSGAETLPPSVRAPGIGTRGGPGARTPRIAAATTEIVSNASASAAGGARLYSQSDGRFYKIGRDGSLTPLSDAVFYNVEKVTWSPKTNESIIEYPDGANIYYNFDTKRQVTLPKHWEEFSYAASGDRIAAKSMGLSQDNRWLITANPDGSDTRRIEPMGENADKVIVGWSPTKHVVALSRTGDALGDDREEVLLIGQNGENFKSLEVEGRGIRSAWSPDGKKLVYSVYSARSDFKPELWVVNAEGDAVGSGRNFLSMYTWADKCAFQDSRSLFCAVPRTLSAGAGFAPALADNTPDQIVKVDLATGAKSEIRTDEAYTIDSMFVGDNGKTLYFTDKRKPGLFHAPL